MLTALANVKPYLMDLFQVYPVLQSCWETTTCHCQPDSSGSYIITSAKPFPELTCRVAKSNWELTAAGSGGWGGSRQAEWPFGVLHPLPCQKWRPQQDEETGLDFLQFILHSSGELEKYFLLRITLAHLFLQLYSPSNQVDLARRIRSHSELCLAKIISLTLHASGKHNKIQLMVLLQVCACYNTRIVGLLPTDDWC